MRNFVGSVVGVTLLVVCAKGFVLPGVVRARCSECTPADGGRVDAKTGPRSPRTTALSYVCGGERPSSTRLFAKATYKNFEDMLEKEPGALLVDFYATWCGPCSMMSENLAVVGPKMKDELKIFKIDTDKYPNLMSKFGVNGLPTLVLFKEGKELTRMEGVMPAEMLIQQLRYFLGGAAAAATEGAAAASGDSDQGGDACTPPPPPPPSQDACAPPPRDACPPPPQN
ncbi:unnamed protein product [Ectocarpus sp. 6 AP-2014]